MEIRKPLKVAGALAILLIASAQPSPAQITSSDSNNSQRQCQTIVQCRFAKGDVYRGCISAYSCRRCSTVLEACTIDGRRQVCSRLRCNWN